MCLAHKYFLHSFVSCVIVVYALYTLCAITYNCQVIVINIVGLWFGLWFHSEIKYNNSNNIQLWLYNNLIVNTTGALCIFVLFLLVFVTTVYWLAAVAFVCFFFHQEFIHWQCRCSSNRHNNVSVHVIRFFWQQCIELIANGIQMIFEKCCPLHVNIVNKHFSSSSLFFFHICAPDLLMI